MRGFIDRGREGLYLNARASGRGRGTVGVELVRVWTVKTKSCQELLLIQSAALQVVWQTLCIFPFDWMQPLPLKSVERFGLVTFWILLIGLKKFSLFFSFFFKGIVQIGHRCEPRKSDHSSRHSSWSRLLEVVRLQLGVTHAVGQMKCKCPLEVCFSFPQFKLAIHDVQCNTQAE